MIFSKAEKEWRKKCRMPKTSKLIIAILLLSFTFLLPTKVLSQAVIESDNYKIQMPNFNSGAGIPSSGNYKLDTTIGQTTAGLFSSSGYLVRNGFQYIHSIIPFSFSISNFLINFGSLTPDSPATQTSTLTVSDGGAGGYRVMVKENDYLKSSAGNIIADTLCDGDTCSETTAGIWSQTTTYGFGYNMSGNDVPAEFAGPTYYKHFPNISLGQTEQTVMSSSNVSKQKVATITYKINISGIQSGGDYQNKILFTAIPSY